MKDLSNQDLRKNSHVFPLTFKKKPGIIKIRINTTALPEAEPQKREQAGSSQLSGNKDMKRGQHGEHQDQDQQHQRQCRLEQHTQQSSRNDLFFGVQPLPPPWQMVMDSDMSFYFRHPGTQQVQRERPSL